MHCLKPFFSGRRPFPYRKEVGGKNGVLKPLLVLCPANKLQNSTKGFQTAARLIKVIPGT
jgi:hypothetical protein